jgi:hypothetical protein
VKSSSSQDCRNGIEDPSSDPFLAETDPTLHSKPAGRG